MKVKELQLPSLGGFSPKCLIAALLLFLTTGAPRLVASEVTLFEGTLGASKIAIASPGKSTGDLVLYAHGYRPPNAPLAVALDIKNSLNRSLLERGWVIAATSFRRNGWIIDDAILDLRELRAFVESKHPEVKRVVLIGSSMGGYIGAKVAEKPDGLADAVLALGAGGFPKSEADFAKEFSRQPKIPFLFLSNIGEADAPKFYAKGAPTGSVAVWTVERPGHVNLSSREQRAAMEALIQWLDGAAPELNRDATAPGNPGPSQARFTENSAEAKVGGIAPVHGNFETAFIAEDLQKLGLKQGDRFQVEANGKVLEVLWGTGFSDVPEGEGVAFFNAEGVLRIARNFANAATTLGVREGDMIIVRPLVQKAK